MIAIHAKPAIFQQMMDLVQKNSTEVGWYGVCERKGDDVEIVEILEYPQRKSATRVTTKGVPEYDEWLINLPIEKANKIRFAGHSHVNMPAVPSTIDIADEKTTLSQLDEDDYYIFFILNKRGEWDLRFHENGKVHHANSLRRYMEAANESFESA